jgi:CDP-4-dehydro-6-deoxyglucose reductase, E3
VRLTVSGRDLDLRRGETVLTALARGGVPLPSACRAGVCQACLLRAVRGDPGSAARAGLADSLRADGYFLACTARPTEDLTVALAGQDVFTPAELAAVRPVGRDLIRVWIRPSRRLEFLAGQHVALRAGLATGGEVVRVYSIANLPGEAARDGLEFFVRVYPQGRMSGWLAQARPGQPISLGRPAGACCYRPQEPEVPLLLAGTGTGMAPLLAIARDAAEHGHRGPVIALRGAPGPAGLYSWHWPAPVRSRTCLLSRGEDIVAAVTSALCELAAPASARAYLCGSPDVVAQMRRSLFLAGLSLRRIHGDEFAQAA